MRACGPPDGETTAAHVRRVLERTGTPPSDAVLPLLGLLDPQQSKSPAANLQDALVRLLRGHSADWPVLVLLDQLFWADHESLESLPGPPTVL